MGFGSLFRGIGKVAGLIGKHGPKVGKALGQISEGGRKFGTVLDAGRKLGTTIDQASGGKIGNSKFGRDVNNLADKADTITNRVVSEAKMGQDVVKTGLDKLAQM